MNCPSFLYKLKVDWKTEKFGLSILEVNMKDIMHISKILQPDMIIDLQSVTKGDALDDLLDVITHSALITDKKKFRKAIKDREKLMSRGIGYGVVVPHARDKTVKDFVIAVDRSAQGVSYEWIDDKPVELIFMIGASAKEILCI